MEKMGPIVIIEDSLTEQQKLKEAFAQVGADHQVVYFESATVALHYLKETPDKPFVILSNLDLPEMTGLEFLDKIHEDNVLRRKTIPFIYFANEVQPRLVMEAYDRRVQGYFLKPKSTVVLKLTLLSILDYWGRSTHPDFD